MLVDSRCLEFDGDGIVLPVAFTFTLRPMSGPFALITLVLAENKIENDKERAGERKFFRFARLKGKSEDNALVNIAEEPSEFSREKFMFGEYVNFKVVLFFERFFIYS